LQTKPSRRHRNPFSRTVTFAIHFRELKQRAGWKRTHGYYRQPFSENTVWLQQILRPTREASHATIST
jgi:hypothetical protein